jgi:hypothetical protein
MLPFLPVLAVAVDLLTATDCPSRAEIAAELAHLGSVASGPSSDKQDAPRLSAEIRWVGDGLSIALRTPQGTLAAQRTLTRSGSCLDLAAASAVVIAAWQGEVRGDLGPELPASQQGAARPVPLREPSTSAAAWAVPERARRPWEVGVGVVGSRQGDLAPGLAIDAEVGRPQSRLAGRLGLVVTGAHALTLGPPPGQSLWSHAAVNLGVRRRFWLGDSALDGHLSVAVALIRLEGAGFGANYTQTGFDFGFGAGIRWAWPTRRLAPFVGLDALAWPSQKFVTLAGSDAEARLPRFELLGAAGISVGRFR